MSDIIKTGPTSLADFESLISDKDVARKVFIHTIRDYMPFFDQAALVTANDGMGDRGEILTVYPEGETHGYNQGWKAENPEGTAVRYTCERRSDSNEIDVDQYMDQPAKDRDTWRFRRDQAFARGFAKAMVRDVFYGDPATDPTKMRGFFNIVNPANPAFKDRIINAGGTTANKQTEIVLIGWDTAFNYLFKPQHNEDSTGGFQVKAHDDPIRAYKTTGGIQRQYWKLITDFRWDLGLAIYDPLTVVRIANIDTTKLSKSNKTSGSPDLLDLMTQAVELLPDQYKGRCAFYLNDTLSSVLRRQINNKDNLQLTLDTIAGRKVIAWDGIPVHKLGSDVLTNTNAVLSLS